MMTKTQYHLRLVVSTLLALSLPALAHASLSFSFPDPVGDTFGLGPIQHDIIATEVTLTDTDVMFRVVLSGAITAPSDLADDGVFGDVDLDIDQDSSTGATSNVTLFGNQPSGLGIEYYVDIFRELSTPGFVDLVDASTLTATASLPISFATDSFSFSIPLSALSNDDGYLGFGVIVGTLDEPTDQMVARIVRQPDGTIPEPRSILIWTVLSACILGGGWKQMGGSSERQKEKDEEGEGRLGSATLAGSGGWRPTGERPKFATDIG